MTIALDARYSAITDHDADHEGPPRPGPCKQTRTEQSAMRAGHAGWMQSAWSGGATRAAIQRQPLDDAPAAPASSSAPSQLEPWDMTAGLMSAMGLAAAAEEGVAGAAAPLPHLDAIQRSFGRHDVSGIRAQIGGAAAAASRRLGAHAYATGSRIAFAAAPDLHTAAHEAAHVIQQASGDVQLPDGIGQRGDRYERHADEVADAVVAGRSAEPLLDRFAPAAKTATSAAPAGPQRRAVQLAAADYKTPDELKAMTLGAFDTYANSQADWTSSTSLNGAAQFKAEKEELRALLVFARGNRRFILNACGNLNVGELLQQQVGKGGAVDATLRAYALAATPGQNQSTANIHAASRATQVPQALRWGAALEKLVPKLGGHVVHAIITQQPSARMLALLARYDQVDDLIDYVSTYAPLLDGGGMEIIAFSEFATEGGLPMLPIYKALLPEIRNYHRFTKAQLDALLLNKAAARSNRARAMPLPICVVLRSGFDHNGAFRRDPGLTKVIHRLTHLTFVVEGKPTLDDYGQELEKFASFGRDGKIDEALLAGHGNTTFMGMAGHGLFAPNDSQYKKAQQPVSLDDRLDPSIAKATSALFAKLTEVLRDAPSSRVVLEACLTNTNEVDVKLDPDPDTAAAQIRAAIQARPNLVMALQRALGEHRARVIGANGSAYRPRLLDGPDAASGGIDLVSDDDPQLTAPDKLAYVKHGTEPEGVLRAVLEQWAKDRATTIGALQERALRTAADRKWKEQIISGFLELILAAPDDGEQIRASSKPAATLAEMELYGNCSFAKLQGLNLSGAQLAALLPRLEASDAWADPAKKHLPMVFWQRWIATDHAKIAAFHTFLDGSGYTTASAGLLFDWKRMTALAALLLPLPPAPATPPPGTFLLALLALQQLGKGAPQAAVSYLRAVIGHGNKVFPATCNVDAILAGTTAQKVLDDLGLGAGSPAAPPNVAPTGQGNNTVAVIPLMTTATTAGSFGNASAYMLPEGEKIGRIPNGRLLHVIGHVKGPMQGAFSFTSEDNAPYCAVETTELPPYKVVFVDAGDLVGLK